MNDFFAVCDCELVPVDELELGYFAFVHWTLDFDPTRLEWRAVAWTPNHDRHFEYALDARISLEQLMPCLWMLNYDAKKRLEML